VLVACGWSYLNEIKGVEIKMNCYAKTLKKVTGQSPWNSGILDGGMGN
jgi:hypothetical protein